MEENKTYSPAALAEKLVQYCVSMNKKFIYISGNGGSGKTEFAKTIAQVASKFGRVNVLDTDDFVVNTKLRNNSVATWTDKSGVEKKGRYTTAFEASFFLQNIKAIICNLKRGNNYIHWPKKAISESECRTLYSSAILTIIEGVGTVFLQKDKDDSISVFLHCTKEIEIGRRISRSQFSNEKNAKEVYEKYEERNSQFEANIAPHINEYDILLESLFDYSLSVMSDHLSIL